jgi:hypothetical protein
MDRKALLIAVGAGAAAQLALVLLGHFIAFVADNLFALGGAAIALAAGAVYARKAAVADPRPGAALAGAAGAVAAILVSTILGDVPWPMLLIGALAGAAFGLAGGTIGRNGPDGSDATDGPKP